MTQQQYNIIIECIKYGAPAFSKELITVLDNTITDNNELVRQVQEFQKQLKEKEDIINTLTISAEKIDEDAEAKSN